MVEVLPGDLSGWLCSANEFLAPSSHFGKNSDMSIDVVPQTRIDHLATGINGESLRRTDHRGIVWYGGRQAAQTGGMMTMRSQTAGIVTPFWVPDTLAYRTDMVDHILLSIAASVLYVPENCALADVAVRLAINEQRPDVSHVLVHLQGAARIPIGVSYEVTVLAPVEAIVTA